MTSSSYSSQSTRPTGRVIWEELLIFSRFHLITSGRVGFLSHVLYTMFFILLKCFHSAEQKCLQG